MWGVQFPHLPLLVLDTETTGFLPKVHRVMEFACASIHGGKLQKEFEQLIGLPEGQDIPEAIQRLTHIVPGDLAGKPEFSEVLPTLQKFLTPETIIVGQNIGFDIGMLSGEGWDLSSYPWIDTSMLASIVFPELPSFSLGFMSEALGLSHTPKHRALGDVRATLELLSRVTERFSELPKKLLSELQAIAKKGPSGYREYFLSLTGTKGTRLPSWCAKGKQTSASEGSALELERPATGTTTLLEEPLSPGFLQALLKEPSGKTWIAVKNLEATLERVQSKAVPLFSPDLLLSAKRLQLLQDQPTFTADEMTLLMKIVLFSPSTRSNVRLHGGEYQTWAAKLAATAEDAEYRDTLQAVQTKPALLSHQHLLHMLEAPEPALPTGAHVIIDDASMLEDTATAAWGWTTYVPTLRAAAAGHTLLTKIVDLVELWSEKVRAGLDLRYLAPSDLSLKESQDLSRLLSDLPRDELLPTPRLALEHLQNILDAENLPGRIAWIESMKDGSKTIKSVPESVAPLLKKRLYDRAGVTLCIPKGSQDALSMILPHDASPIPSRITFGDSPLSLQFPLNVSIQSLLQSLPKKSILLLSSKRAIEDLYVKYGPDFETRGVTLVCQGFSGGQSRMEAEFNLAKGQALLVTTPWTYEGLNLSPESVDQLVIQTLPFDHPSHAVVSRRALRYQDPFTEYSLARLKHRLFRLARQFLTHASPGAVCLVLDDRLRTKAYGKNVQAYLELLSGKGVAKRKASSEQMELL